MSSRAQHFALRELLVVAALASLGGVTGSAVSWIGASVRAVTGLPGNLQFMAGIHVLWLVLALGLVRQPGAATATGMLKGAVELLTGNPHGIIVVLMSGLAGLVVDMVWLLAGRRDRLVVYVAAGGMGAVSNLLIFRLIVALPDHRAVSAALAAIGLVAFTSGALLAGALGWSLMDVLRRAGVAGVRERAGGSVPGARKWAGAADVLLVLAVLAMGTYYSTAQRAAEADGLVVGSPGGMPTSRAP